MIDFSNLSGFIEVSPLAGCSDVNSVVAWCSEAIKSEVLSCGKYARLSEVGLFCAFGVMVVAEWLHTIREKKLRARIKLLEEAQNEKKEIK
jgi:hypothetical protein